jgi:hypothetical protein
VHYRLGDVNPASPLATDEECAQALTDAGGNTYLAAAMLAESKAMVFLLRPTTVTRDGRTVSYMQQADWFRTLAASLRLQATMQTGSAYAGGIEAAERRADQRDTSLNQPFVTKELHQRRVPRDLQDVRGDV